MVFGCFISQIKGGKDRCHKLGFVILLSYKLEPFTENFGHEECCSGCRPGVILFERPIVRIDDKGEVN